MPILPDRLSELDHLSLDHGGHEFFANGHCALEVAAYLAGEPHSDKPVCVCPVIREFVVSWPNNAERDRLIKPLLPKILDTRASPEVMLRRSMLAVDWMVREFTPTWLEAAKLTERAAELRALPEVSTWEAFDAALPVLKSAQVDADAARAAAWAAARAAAWDAARAAAWDAVAPIVARLQESAVALVERMVAVTDATPTP